MMENQPKLSPSRYWQPTMTWGLLIFTLGVAIVAILGEILKTRLIWYLRYTDFFDLLINFPLYMISLILFLELFVDTNAPRRFRIIFLLFAFMFMYGSAMRTSTNAINTFATEIREYPDLPKDMYALIYFMDETLGHVIIDITQFCVFGCLLILEVRYLAPQTTPQNHNWAGAAGIIYGLMESVNFIEGQKVILVPFVLVGLGGLWLWLRRSSQKNVREFIQTGPATAFLTSLLIFFPCGMGIYWITFGNFNQPSQLDFQSANLIPIGTFLGLIALGSLMVYLRHRNPSGKI